METKLTPFLFEGDHLFRSVERDGNPAFVAADACRVLSIKNVAQAVAPLDEDEKGICSIYTPGGVQEVIVVSEGGLYTLILRSRDATTLGTLAHRFRKWVTSEVIPAVRRSASAELPQPETDPEADEVQTADGIKLRKVNTAARIFGERAGAQLWFKLGLEIVPAMKPMLAQMDLLEIEITTRMTGGAH